MGNIDVDQYNAGEPTLRTNGGCGPVRWNDYKDSVVKELRAGGMKKAEAVDEAWRRLAEQYPPTLPVVADIHRAVPAPLPVTGTGITTCPNPDN